MIPVTKPYLPPQNEYDYYLRKIWESNWLTNMGPLSTQLETELKRYLDVKNLLFVTNGTVAIQMAIKALDIKNEIITTPFSFVATTSCIVWESCRPVFVDIDPESFCIDASKIEQAITPETEAILATHVYGNPCDVEKIEAIAKKHNLKVIYDGAHAFGVKIKGKSVFEYGDISTCSFHATKLYHTIEGGMVVCNDPKIHDRLTTVRNFGISGFESFAELGINGKNSEFHAAMGLVNLKYIDNIFQKRKAICELYDKILTGVNIHQPKWHFQATQNYAYYPILLESEEKLLKMKGELEKNNIQTRRYFYPSLASALPYLEKTAMPVADDVAKRILCLPLYYDLTFEEVDLVCRMILAIQST